MKKTRCFLLGLCLTMTACTKEKTNYQAELEEVVPAQLEFKEAVRDTQSGYTVRIEALNGTFYTGYNEIRVKISDQQNEADVQAASVTLLPLMRDAKGEETSGPHRYKLSYVPDSSYFSGYVVLTEASDTQHSWRFYLSFQVDGEQISTQIAVPVEEQPNKNLSMTAFEGNDGAQYIIALVAPKKPQVSENKLIAGIYKLEKSEAPSSGSFPDPAQFAYTEVQDYTLKLDPRMPEPSMGNHSSPNNQDLRPGAAGLYYGIVNYTMTGNWTLNFILINQNGKVLKGTEVPKDFTPGVEGEKSELYIDILF